MTYFQLEICRMHFRLIIILFYTSSFVQSLKFVKHGEIIYETNLSICVSYLAIKHTKFSWRSFSFIYSLQLCSKYMIIIVQQCLLYNIYRIWTIWWNMKSVEFQLVNLNCVFECSCFKINRKISLYLIITLKISHRKYMNN